MGNIAEIEMFEEIDFLTELEAALNYGYDPLSFQDIIDLFGFSFPSRKYGTSCCSGIAYSRNTLKVVSKSEFLSFICENYGYGSSLINIEIRPELKIPEQHKEMILLREIVPEGCFQVTPEIFKSFRGREYTFDEAEKYGFTTAGQGVPLGYNKMQAEQLTGNPFVLDLAEGNASTIDKIISEGGISMGFRGNTVADKNLGCCIKTLLVYNRGCVNDWGLETYDVVLPILGRRMQQRKLIDLME